MRAYAGNPCHSVDKMQFALNTHLAISAYTEVIVQQYVRTNNFLTNPI